MGLYTRGKSLYQRRKEGLGSTNIGPIDPEDLVEDVEKAIEKIEKVIIESKENKNPNKKDKTTK